MNPPDKDFLIEEWQGTDFVLSMAKMLSDRFMKNEPLTYAGVYGLCIALSLSPPSPSLKRQLWFTIRPIEGPR